MVVQIIYAKQKKKKKKKKYISIRKSRNPHKKNPESIYPDVRINFFEMLRSHYHKSIVKRNRTTLTQRYTHTRINTHVLSRIKIYKIPFKHR